MIVKHVFETHKETLELIGESSGAAKNSTLKCEQNSSI